MNVFIYKICGQVDYRSKKQKDDSQEHRDSTGMYHDFEQISKGNGNILDVIGNNIRNAGFDPPRDVQKIRYN